LRRSVLNNWDEDDFVHQSTLLFPLFTPPEIDKLAYSRPYFLRTPSRREHRIMGRGKKRKGILSA